MDQVTPVAPSTELKALLDAIDKQEFKALSTGLGLGSTRPAGMPKTRYPQARAPLGAAEGAPPWSTAGAAALPPLSAPQPAQVLAASMAATRSPLHGTGGARGPAAAAPRQAGLSRLLLAWSLDLVFVAVTLAGALALAFAAHAWRTGQTSWLSGKPVQWLLGLNPVLSLAGVYALFLVYALFFRVLVGRTCGETLLGIRPTPRLTRRKA